MGEDDGDEEETINYRGEINRSEWREFKRNVPRTKKLSEKVNELIREFNASQRNGNENHNGNGDT